MNWFCNQKKLDENNYYDEDYFMKENWYCHFKFGKYLLGSPSRDDIVIVNEKKEHFLVHIKGDITGFINGKLKVHMSTYEDGSYKTDEGHVFIEGDELIFKNTKGEEEKVCLLSIGEKTQ